MRISERKIQALADKLVRWLETQPGVTLLGERDAVRDAIVQTFEAERDLERQLDEDVDRILQQNESRMKFEGIDPWVMRKKNRAQLARERRMIL
jgi:hypothetical protein